MVSITIQLLKGTLKLDDPAHPWAGGELLFTPSIQPISSIKIKASWIWTFPHTSYIEKTTNIVLEDDKPHEMLKNHSNPCPVWRERRFC